MVGVILGLRKRSVLRLGYGSVIAVLILTTVEAYRIQVNISEQHLYIYRNYIDMDDAVSVLRRNLWLAGSDIRDFFINTTPEQAGLLRNQIAGYRVSDEKALARLAHVPGWRNEVPKLRKALAEFWTAVEPVPALMLNESDDRKFAFLQNVVVPRRGELYAALLALSAADQQKVKEGEREFAVSRRSAGIRLLGMLGISALLCLIVARLSVRYSESLELRAEEHLHEVERARAELQQLSARLLHIEEEGKRTLSRELHDEIGQTLALLEIEISNAQKLLADPQQAKERLLRARDLARRTVQAVRDISVLLRPALLDDLGLVPALQFQIDDFLRRSGIACEFVENGVQDDLPDAVKTCIYRVIQETLHNAEKHSGATRIKLELTQANGNLSVSIRDNGRGFEMPDPKASAGRGLGLLGIRERVAIAGGTVAIDSEPGAGTCVSLRLPVPPAPETKEMTKSEVTA